MVSHLKRATSTMSVSIVRHHLATFCDVIFPCHDYLLYVVGAKSALGSAISNPITLFLCKSISWSSFYESVAGWIFVGDSSDVVNADLLSKLSHLSSDT